MHSILITPPNDTRRFWISFGDYRFIETCHMSIEEIPAGEPLREFPNFKNAFFAYFAVCRLWVAKWQSLLESAKAPLPLNGNTLNDRKQNRKSV